ncbi:MAG TPA: hypothetical protein PKA00_16885 [Saprospiraceae bacterium]|nr:hypothetical protein [Saprospiraceae bacterium]HMQ84594.1 hypothetical protein [Saprospiraceae bacterium]
MDQLDQFFRNKMEARFPQWDDAYWRDAEKLIEAQEKKRKRRLLFWWLSGIALAVGILASVYWFLQPIEKAALFPSDGHPAAHEAKTPIPTPFTEVELAPAPQQASSSAANNGITMTDPRTNIDFAVSLGQKSNDPIELMPLLQQNEDRAFRQDKASTLPDPFDNILADSFKNNVTSALAPLPTEELGNSAITPALENKVYALKLPIRPLEKDISMATAPPIKPIKNSYWQLRLTGTPDLESSKNLLSGTLGLSQVFPINEQYTIEAGVQYRYRTGTLDSLPQVSISSYRFGKIEDRYFLKPNALHYLELPVLIRKTFYKKHTLAIGGSWSYLIGLEGSLKAQNNPEFSFAFGDLQTIEQGWMDSAGYKNSFFSLLARYEYRLMPKWQLHVGAQYTPGGILSAAAPHEQNILLLQSPKLLMEMGIGIRLFN